MARKRNLAPALARELLLQGCHCQDRDKLRQLVGELMSAAWSDGYAARAAEDGGTPQLFGQPCNSAIIK